MLLLLLASPPLAAETVVVPPIFEDFAGPAAVELFAVPSRGGLRGRWKIETLVPAAELGAGVMTLKRIGVRADERHDGGNERLRGSVTLSTTRAGALRPRFAENAGESPVTFFVEGKRNVKEARRSRQEAYVFDLPGGFRFDPGHEGNLHVHLELEAEADCRLDAAPALEPRLLVASEFLAPTGDLSLATLVLLFTLDRELPFAWPNETLSPVARPSAPAPSPLLPPSTAEPTRREPAGEGEALAERVRRLERRIASLETSLERASEAAERQARRIESEVRSIGLFVRRHYVENALASGRPAPAMLKSSMDGGSLETGRDVAREAVQLARAGGLEVGGAEGLVALGDRQLARGLRGDAFASYSRAFRSVLAGSGPGIAEATQLQAAEPVSELRSGGVDARRAPYHISSDYPHW